MIITIQLNEASIAKDHNNYKVLFEGKYIAVIRMI